MKHPEQSSLETPPSTANIQPEIKKSTKRELGRRALIGLSSETASEPSVNYDRYLKNRQSGNRFLLANARKSESNNGSPFRLLAIYDTLLTEGIRSAEGGGKDITRLLKSIKLVDARNDDDEAYFDSSEHYTDQFSRSIAIPTIHMNFSNIDVYKNPSNLAGDLTGMDELFMEISTEVGVSYEEMVNNGSFCAAFVFLHEFGHAVDSMRELETRGAIDADNLRVDPAIMNNSIKRTSNKRRRYEIERDHIAELSPEVRNRRYEAHGVDPNSFRDISLFFHRSYREMPDESFADKFAYDFIKTHPSLFFTMNKDEQDTDRLYIHLGEKMPVSDEAAFCTGLREGRAVELKTIPNDSHQEANNELTGRFYLAKTPKIGQPLELSITANPNDLDFVAHRTSPIREMYSITESNLNNDPGELTLQTQYFLQLEDGTKMTYKNAGRPPLEYHKVEELAESAKTSPGSVIQLLKTGDIINGRSSIEQGDVLSGIVPESGLSKGIVLTDSSGHRHDISLTDAYRSWKTWFLRSYDSIFEILPSNS